MENRVYTWSLWKCCLAAVFGLETKKLTDSKKRLSSFKWFLPELRKRLWMGATALKTLPNFESKYNTKKIDMEVVVCCSLFSIHFLMVFSGFRVNWGKIETGFYLLIMMTSCGVKWLTFDTFAWEYFLNYSSGLKFKLFVFQYYKPF